MAKVLVVDDDKIIRETLKKLLDLDGHETFTAEHGQEGVEIFHKEKPEIALVDIKMPGMDGIEVLKRIKEISEQTEVIIITGHGEVGTAIQALKEGAFSYIQKPVEYDELALEISRISEKQKIINDRKRAQEALRESEERFRSISICAQDSIIVLNNEGNISDWNKAAQRTFGYTEEEAIGKEMHSLIGPERYHEAFRKGFSGFKETGEGPIVGTTLDLSAIRKDGTEFPIELSVSSVKVQGKWHSVGIVRDITERKQLMQKEKEFAVAEAAARAEGIEVERRRLEYIFESMVDGVAIVDFDGIVRHVNGEFERITGWKKEKVVGASVMEIGIFPQKEGKVIMEEVISRLIKEGAVRNVDTTITSKDGRGFPVSMNWTLMKDAQGRMMGGTVVMRDISELKRAQEAIAEARADKERIKKLERDLNTLEQLSGVHSTTVTARMFGLVPLREAGSEIFEGVVVKFINLLDLSLEQKMYKVEHNISESLRLMAEEMGYLKAGPKDVIDIYSAALRKKKSDKLTSKKAMAYADEGKLMIIQLMGFLVSFYRKFS